MLEKLFLLFLALAIGYLGYETYTLYHLKYGPFKASPEQVWGPEEADLTVVEFIDYSCPHCRAVHPVITEAVETDGKVRLIVRPVYSQNEDAVRAAFVVQAAAEQDKFYEMHNYLISKDLPALKNQDVLFNIAQDLGLNFSKFMEDLGSKKIGRRARDNHRMMLARKGIEYVPAFLIGKKIEYMPENTPSVDDFLALFNEARALENR